MKEISMRNEIESDNLKMKLATLFRRRDLSHIDIAAHLGCSRSAVSKSLRCEDHRGLPVDKLLGMLAMLELTISDKDGTVFYDPNNPMSLPGGQTGPIRRITPRPASQNLTASPEGKDLTAEDLNMDEDEFAECMGMCKMGEAYLSSPEALLEQKRAEKARRDGDL